MNLNKLIYFSITICLIFILAGYSFGYLIPTLQKQSKQLTCLDEGYFDYNEESNTCWDWGHYNVDDFECVKEGNCKGRHYVLSEDQEK